VGQGIGRVAPRHQRHHGRIERSAEHSRRGGTGGRAADVEQACGPRRCTRTRWIHYHGEKERCTAGAVMVDVKMPLTAHREELRWRIIKALAAVTVGFIASYNFTDTLFELLARPLLTINAGADANGRVVTLIGTGIGEAFFTKLKVALIAAIFVASPVVLYQIWQFVAPGLYDTEKRYARPFVFFGTFFFVAGATFCYLLVLPVGYRFFMEQYGTIGVEPQIRISEYLTFTSRMLLAFGATFELPVFTFFLARVGLV